MLADQQQHCNHTAGEPGQKANNLQAADSIVAAAAIVERLISQPPMAFNALSGSAFSRQSGEQQVEPKSSSSGS
jgi:hypothetical protein